jgi:hypothetical protein
VCARARVCLYLSLFVSLALFHTPGSTLPGADSEEYARSLTLVGDVCVLRVCCLLVLDSVTSTPQWIRQPKLRDDIITVPITNLFAWGEGDTGGRVLWDATGRGLCGLVCP